jgi:hypothetical protein
MNVLARSLFFALVASLVACSTSEDISSPGAAALEKDAGAADTSSPPPASDAGTSTDARAAAAAQLIFLNFDDVTLAGVEKAVGDDATKNQTPLFGPDGATDVEGWVPTQFGLSRAEVIARVTAKVDEMFGPFDVKVVHERPQAPLTYSMVVLTDLVVNVNSFGGSADLDCGNDNASNVSVVFPNAILGNPDPDIVSYLSPGGVFDEERGIWAVAYVSAHEVGHTMGLEDTSEGTDIMFPDPFGHHGMAFTGGPVKDFISGSTTSRCTNENTQDSRQILLGLLGPRSTQP